MLIKMGGSTGGGAPDWSNAPQITFDGKWSKWYVEDYNGIHYWEAVFYTSGTLTVSGTLVADAWGIGGGGGYFSNSGAGASGYTGMMLNATLSGSLAVSIGAGAPLNTNSPGGTTALGTLVTCLGGTLSSGGSGSGGSNGSNGDNTGDGLPMCRFREPCKADDAGDAVGTGCGGSGWLHWYVGLRDGRGYGGGGGFNQTYSEIPGHPGALVIRVKM